MRKREPYHETYEDIELCKARDSGRFSLRITSRTKSRYCSSSWQLLPESISFIIASRGQGVYSRDGRLPRLQEPRGCSEPAGDAPTSRLDSRALVCWRRDPSTTTARERSRLTSWISDGLPACSDAHGQPDLCRTSSACSAATERAFEAPLPLYSAPVTKTGQY